MTPRMTILFAFAVLAASALLSSTLAKARRHRHTKSNRAGKHRGGNRHHYSNTSATNSCFDENVHVGTLIQNQGPVGDHGSVSIVNGANTDLWIIWTASENHDAPFAKKWTETLNKGNQNDNYWWMNDVGVYILMRGKYSVLCLSHFKRTHHAW